MQGKDGQKAAILYNETDVELKFEIKEVNHTLAILCGLLSHSLSCEFADHCWKVLIVLPLSYHFCYICGANLQRFLAVADLLQCIWHKVLKLYEGHHFVVYVIHV